MLVGGVVKSFLFVPDTHLFLAEEAADSGNPTPSATDGTTPGVSPEWPFYVIVQSGGIVGSDSAAPTADQQIITDAGALPTP